MLDDPLNALGWPKSTPKCVSILCSAWVMSIWFWRAFGLVLDSDRFQFGFGSNLDLDWWRLAPSLLGIIFLHYGRLLWVWLRPPRGVFEAHLHQAYKTCVIGAIQSQTYSVVHSYQQKGQKVHDHKTKTSPNPRGGLEKGRKLATSCPAGIIHFYERHGIFVKYLVERIMPSYRWMTLDHTVR